MLYFIICTIQLGTVLIQLLLIMYSKEYIIVISIGLLLITNYYTLFKLVRDYLIVKNIYQNQS
jgi:Putative transmembrane protein